MRYAIYDRNSNTVQTFVASSTYSPEPPYELIEESELPEGWSYPPSPPPVWTNLEFYNKFTLLEKMAFETASVATTEQGAAIAVLLTTFLVNPRIWAADPSFIYGMQSLVAVGVITSERLLEIMDGYQFPE